MQDDECLSEFRFLKNDKYGLFDVLEIPKEIISYNGSKLNGVYALYSNDFLIPVVIWIWFIVLVWLFPN